ncbi:9760_t:CDS:1, partial [Ambispora leptoticha]
ITSSEVISENNTLDRRLKKKKSGSNPRSVQISDSVNIINKADITNNLIKNVDEMDDLQAKLTQSHKEREE